MTIDLSTEVNEEQNKPNPKEQLKEEQNTLRAAQQEVYQMEQENGQDIYQNEKTENRGRGSCGCHRTCPIIGALAAVWAVLVLLGIGRINMYLMMDKSMASYAGEEETNQETMSDSRTEEADITNEQMQEIMISAGVEETLQQSEEPTEADPSLQADEAGQSEEISGDETPAVMEDESQQQDEQIQDSGSLFNEETVETEYWMYIGLNDRDTYRQEIATEEAKVRLSRICATYVDGYTMFEAFGGWVDEQGVLTEELTLVCVFREATEEQMQAIMEEVLADFNQNAVLLERRSADAAFYNGNE